MERRGWPQVWSRRGGGACSPASGAGFVAWALLGALLLGLGGVLALHREPFGILPAVFGALFVRDAWAWARLTADGRAAFASHVNALRQPLPVVRVPAWAAAPVVAAAVACGWALRDAPTLPALLGLIVFGTAGLFLLVDQLRGVTSPTEGSRSR